MYPYHTTIILHCVHDAGKYQTNKELQDIASLYVTSVNHLPLEPSTVINIFWSSDLLIKCSFYDNAYSVSLFMTWAAIYSCNYNAFVAIAEYGDHVYTNFRSNVT